MQFAGPEAVAASSTTVLARLSVSQARPPVSQKVMRQEVALTCPVNDFILLLVQVFVATSDRSPTYPKYRVSLRSRTVVLPVDTKATLILGSN